MEALQRSVYTIKGPGKGPALAHPQPQVQEPSSPVSTGGTFQDPQWMPENTGGTVPGVWCCFPTLAGSAWVRPHSQYHWSCPLGQR